LAIELSSILRLMYFPVLLLVMQVVAMEGYVSKDKVHSTLIYFGILIIASLVLGEVSGLGGSIAGRGVDVEGKKGFMIGANEVGLMLLLTAPYTMFCFQRYYPFRFFPHLSSLAVYTAAGLLVFTKSSLIAPVVTLVGWLSFGFSNRNKLKRWLFFIFVCITALALVNFVMGRIGDIVEFAMKTFMATLVNDGLVNFLFRGRETYIDAIFPQLVNNEFNFLIVLFGAGEYYIRTISVSPLMREVGEGSMFEMDMFDLLGSVGIVGTFFYISLIFILVKNIKPKNFLFVTKFALVLSIAHSFMAGHVLFSPQVTTIIALILLLHSDKVRSVSPVKGSS
jgi:hypothetical protein